MSLLNRLRKAFGVSSPDRVPEVCYAVAYFIVPEYAFNHFDRLEKIVAEQGNVAGAFFFVMGCQNKKIDPDPAVARSLILHRGKLDDDREYFLFEYPEPPPFDMNQLEGILAPHFSILIKNVRDNTVKYYVLGQAPMDGGTTLREVRYKGEERSNANLGPGPKPDREEFLKAVQNRK